MNKKYNGSQWNWNIQVYNDMRVSKWWNFNFLIKYAFTCSDWISETSEVVQFNSWSDQLWTNNSESFNQFNEKIQLKRMILTIPLTV